MKNSKTNVQATRRYAIIGTGHRSSMFTNAILNDYAHIAKLVAFCDTNAKRMEFWKSQFQETSSEIVCYDQSDFSQMIKEQSVDVVIVTTIDRYHHQYIAEAMRQGCDVISEKPMTIDVPKCHHILDAIEDTGRDLRVTFNYRYSARNSRVKELLKSGKIGKVSSIHFEWFLDTKHGADYFRRWHRKKENSGGLLVHKSTHHFDLVNWWLDSKPNRVSAMGDLAFYGRSNAEERGVTEFYERGTDDGAEKGDPFALDLRKDKTLKGLYFDAEHLDGYKRDRSVFDEDMDIEDDIGVLVQYENNAILTYHLNAYAPKEGYRVVFNGSKGRLEFNVLERAYVSGSDEDHNAVKNVGGGGENQYEEPTSIIFQPLWGKPEKIEIGSVNAGGHGGADPLLLKDIFEPDASEDPLGRAAGHIDGVMSIMTGIAANRSIETGQTMVIEELLGRKLS